MTAALAVIVAIVLALWLFDRPASPIVVAQQFSSDVADGSASPNTRTAASQISEVQLERFRQAFGPDEPAFIEKSGGFPDVKVVEVSGAGSDDVYQLRLVRSRPDWKRQEHWKVHTLEVGER